MEEERELEGDVRGAIAYDGRVVDQSTIAISVRGSRVTLRGSVGTFYEKRAAGKAARHVVGITDVDNQLRVVLMTEHRHDDAEIRAQALQRLIWSSAVPEGVDAEVEDGRLTLSGEVDWRHQADAAYDAVADLVGVTDVINRIAIRPRFTETATIADDIQRALVRSAQIDARRILVSADDGRVVLRGTVSTVAERDAALAAARAAPGVDLVVDRLEVAA
jgi:osmotically-inducible protein OsmY